MSGETHRCYYVREVWFISSAWVGVIFLRLTLYPLTHICASSVFLWILEVPPFQSLSFNPVKEKIRLKLLYFLSTSHIIVYQVRFPDILDNCQVKSIYHWLWQKFTDLLTLCALYSVLYWESFHATYHTQIKTNDNGLEFHMEQQLLTWVGGSVRQCFWSLGLIHALRFCPFQTKDVQPWGKKSAIVAQKQKGTKIKERSVLRPVILFMFTHMSERWGLLARRF